MNNYIPHLVPLFHINVVEVYGFFQENSITSLQGGDQAFRFPQEFNYLNTEVKRIHLNSPHLSLDQVYSSFNEGHDEVLIAKQVEGVNSSEIINLATSLEDVDKFEALEHIRTNYIATSPNVKLYYPEPFIASASFMHNDIGFLHILQYQF